MAQEKMDSWWEYARELAKAERELKIEKWVYISIEYKEENGERVVLYHYDLPRELHERYHDQLRGGAKVQNDHRRRLQSGGYHQKYLAYRPVEAVY